MKTPKHLEMEGNLPHPDISRSYCAFLWEQLRVAGISLDKDTLLLIGQLTSEFIQSTEEGKKLVFQMLRTQISRATPGDLCFQAGKENTREGQLKAEDLLEYRGWIFRKKIPLPYNSVSVLKGGDLNGCDGCGILGPKEVCVTQVRTRLSGGRDAVEDLCNYCRLHNNDRFVQQGATRRTCESCPKLGCQHHPASKQIPLALPAARR